uniref:Mediator complex subunit Med12 domain-containing protein n=1 Tax=Trichobilharzia regenti TaxID=157069 RepID=A0AA85KBZ2_TRIRE|nr:unnamed protein product [Trichobilharzia regenti]
MSNFPSLECRSLKRKEHCPPDVYCQRIEQKEDLMCEDFVKDGFKYMKPVRDEYESCKEESRFLSSEAVWNSYYNIMLKKFECSNFQDFKKRQTTNIRDTVIPAIDMYKEQVCDWFKELSNNVSLQNLGRRVPFFKDKEECLHELLINKVPISRALWFVNMSIIQSTAVAETAKKKPRAPQDPTADWSSTLCRMLSRTLEPIYAPIKHNELVALYSDWDYLFSLLIGMYDADIADHWEVIIWLIKLVENVYKEIRGNVSPKSVDSSPVNNSSHSVKCASDFPLKFILHYLVKFGRRFTESELLIRRLLYWCCTTFANVVLTCTGSEFTPSASTFQGILNEYKELNTCPLHRHISLSLGSLITFIILSCPSAAVWNPIPFDTDHTYFRGSPLDHIPHSLIALPLPRGEESISVRKCLSEVEENIISRSQLVESGWFIEPSSANNGGNVKRLVCLLEILDRHEYHLVREPNPMESLYNRIFNDDSIHEDTATVVTTLCEWAVSPYRIGIYRSIIVACLLEQFKNTFIESTIMTTTTTTTNTTTAIATTTAPNNNSNTLVQPTATTTTVPTVSSNINTNTTSTNTANNNTNANSTTKALKAYQSLQETLIKFLDNCTAQLPSFNGEQSLIENDLMRNLVCLFSELIDREVFDHDNYVRHFIARGVFDTSLHPLAVADNTLQNKLNTSGNPLSCGNNINQSVNTPTSVTRSTTATTSTACHLQSAAQHSVKSEISEDMDRYSMDNPDSVRSESGILSSGVNNSSGLTMTTANLHHTTSTIGNRLMNSNQSGHLHYLIQFPIPQDESYAHEQNQRFQLLYGSVRSRDRARYPIRKLVRDICKLFTKKIYLIDVFHGELGRRKKSKDREREKDNTNSSNNNNNNNSGTNSTNMGTTVTGSTTAAQSTASNAAGTPGSTGGSGSGHRTTNDETRSIDELHEDIMKRFVNLSFYDMEYVLSQCTPVFVKMLNGSNCHSSSNAPTDESVNSTVNTNSPCSASTVTTNQNNNTNNNNSNNLSSVNNQLPASASNVQQSHIYMPVPSSIFLFFELIETSLNITSLILTVIDTLERLKILFENRTHFMTLYMSSLCLRSVGILQRYQNVLFTMGDVSSRLFPTLIEQVRQVKEPTLCGPLERCILIYLNDLFTSNVVIKTRFTPVYGKAHQKVNALLRRVDPNEGMGQFDADYANDLLATTSMDNLTSFRAYAEDLRLKPDSRYSFVCKAIIWICQAKTPERVNYLCSLCAELTSQCSELTPEWIGAFYAILAPRSYVHGYQPLVSTIEPNQVWIYDNLSSLIGTLLSRYCFTISDFLRLVICPAMAQGLDDVSQPVGAQLESIISLACHILHRLFTAESTVSSLQTTSSVLTPTPEVSTSTNTSTINAPGSSGNPDTLLLNSSPPPPFRISEPLLLTAALQKVTSEFLVDVLKMLIVHSDKASVENQAPGSLQGENAEETLDGDGDDNDNDDGEDDDDDDDGVRNSNDRDGDDDDDGELTDIDSEGDTTFKSTTRKRIKASQQKGNKSKKSKRRRRRQHNRKAISQVHHVVQRFLEQDILPTSAELHSLPLNALTQLVLREICTVPWIRERFHQMTTNQLIRENVLIDKNFSQSQARRLLHIIYWPYDLSWTDIASTSEGLSGAMCHVLRDLNIWTLKCAQMEFQLLYSQISFSQQGEVLGYLAQSIVQGFQDQVSNWLDSNNCGNFQDGSIGHVDGLPSIELGDNDPVWLLPALIAKLPKSLKVQIIKVTSEILKGIKHFWKHKNDEDKESVLLQNSILFSHPTFLLLLHVCLPDADFVVDSLYEQIEYFVLNARDIADRVPDNLHTRQIVQQCLKYRLILAGQKFKYIQSDLDMCTRWATLLAQLISHGVTEPESNCSLFYMIYDMLQMLIHSLAARSGIEGKHYQAVAKKIRRELSERPPCSGIEYIRPLLLLTKGAYTIYVTGQSRQSTRGGSSSNSTGSGSLGGGGGAGGGGCGGTGGGSIGKMGGKGGGSAGSGSGGKSSSSKGAGGKSTGHSLLAGGGGGFLTSSSTGSGHHSSHSGGRNQQNKKRGYMLLGKERFTPWEIYDPSKQPLLLSIHGAVHTEAVLSRVEEQANRLIRHEHFYRISRPRDFYMVPVYPETLEKSNATGVGVGVADSKQSDIGEHENANIMRTIKTENLSIDSNTTNNNAVINNIFSSSNNNSNSGSNPVNSLGGESQMLSLNDIVQMPETNLSECQNQFMQLRNSINNNNNNINNATVISSSNSNTSGGILYDQKHNPSTMPCHSTNLPMFNDTGKPVNQIDSELNPMMIMSSLSSSPSCTNTITHGGGGGGAVGPAGSGNIQLMHGKMTNSRNDNELVDKLSINNQMMLNTFKSSVASVAAGGVLTSSTGLPSSNSHIHQQQLYSHHLPNHQQHQQQQVLVNSDPSLSSGRKLQPQQNLMNEYASLNELDQRPIGISHPGHMNTINYPPTHHSHGHHGHPLEMNMHKGNKMINMEYNERMLPSQSLTVSQQQHIQPPPSVAPLPPSNATILHPPISSNTAIHVPAPPPTTTTTTTTTTTKRKRGSGRRGGGGSLASSRSTTGGNTTRGGLHGNPGGPMNVSYERVVGNNPSVNLYAYNVNNSEQQLSDSSNHQWSGKQNVFNMNLLDIQSQQHHHQQQQQQSHVQQSSSSTRGQHQQQQHLANLSGFLRNRAQQQQQQQHQQHHLGQSYGGSSFNPSNPLPMPHSSHMFDQSQLSGQFNPANSHLVEAPTASMRRNITTSGSGGGNISRSIQQSNQQPPPHQIIGHTNTTNTSSATPGPLQQIPQGIPPNPPPYPLSSSNQPQQHAFRIPSDDAYNIMNVNDVGIDEQYRRQTLNPVMNTMHHQQQQQQQPPPHHHHHNQSSTVLSSRVQGAGGGGYDSSSGGQMQTDVQHLSYMPVQADSQMNTQSRLHASRVMSSSQQQSGQLMRPDMMIASTVIETGVVGGIGGNIPLSSSNNNNSAQLSQHVQNIPHSSYPRYTGY